MLASASTTRRSWKIIAEEISCEKDPTKLSRLVAELNQALDEQGVDGVPQCEDKLQSDGGFESV
jgi:hypothetical protein